MSVAQKNLKEECPTCGGLRYLYRDVAPGHPDFGKPIHCPDCYEETIGSKEFDKLAEASGLTEFERRHTFDTLNNWPETKRLRKQVELWVDGILRDRKGWLFLYGAYGTGKTRFGQVILNECIRKGLQGLYFEVPRLLDFLRERCAPKEEEPFLGWVRRIEKVPLLVLDELGKQRKTQSGFGEEKLFEILNYRCERANFLPTVIITNLTEGQLDGMEPWLHSRLQNPEVTKLAFAIEDLREKRKMLWEI